MMKPMGGVVVVVPTIRPDSYAEFKKRWELLFAKHDVSLVTVHDGDEPYVEYQGTEYSVERIMGKYKDLIYNHNDGVRNLGFAFAYKLLTLHSYILSLDDDVYPDGDTIQQHLDILGKKVPVSWMSTASEYTRGFPYGIREEAKVVLSHGVWEGVKDWDAPTQLVMGDRAVDFYKGPIPKGIYFPMCIMNVMFDMSITPWMYQAPMGPEVGIDRFGDIWGGIEAKRDIDKNGYAAVTGYASAIHSRASNVFQNLQKEAKGIGMNEEYGKDEYFKLFKEKRDRWKEFCVSS